MVLQPRFGQSLSEKIPPLYFISILSLFTPSSHLDFGLSWFCLSSGTALYRALCARSISLHDADDIWAVEFPIEFEIVRATTFGAYISCGKPSFKRRVIGPLPFLSAPTFHCRAAGRSRSRFLDRLLCLRCKVRWPHVFADRRSTYLQFEVFTTILVIMPDIDSNNR
jgi:hypothetical protein